MRSKRGRINALKQEFILELPVALWRSVLPFPSTGRHEVFSVLLLATQRKSTYDCQQYKNNYIRTTKE